MSKTKKVGLLDFGADDNGNAECMKALYGEELIYCPAFGWMHYTGTYWKKTSDAVAYKLATDTLKRRMQAANNKGNAELQKKVVQDEKKISNCVKLYRQLSTVEDASSFNNDPDLVNVANGVFNTRTGSLEKHKPCQRFTYCIPYEYRPDADMSMINDLAHDWTGSEEKAHYLQKLAGYSITGHFREYKAIYLYGPGRSGKTTFVETIRHLLNEPLAKAVNFSTFTVERLPDSQNFDLAPLAESRFVVASESNHYQMFNVAKLKEFTGGSTVSAAHKFHDPFNYIPRFKIWFVSNHPPKGDPGDDALWARLIVMTFPFSHIGDEDQGLIDRLWRVENMEGFLRWILEGAMKWQAEGLSIPPEEVIDDIQRYRDEQDYVKLWLSDEPFIRGKDDKIEYLFVENDSESSANLMKSFKQWCIDNNVKPLNPNQFSFELKRLGYTRTLHPKTRTATYIRPNAESKKKTRGERRGAAETPVIEKTAHNGEAVGFSPLGASRPLAPEDEKSHQNGHKPEQIPCPDCGNMDYEDDSGGRQCTNCGRWYQIESEARS